MWKWAIWRKKVARIAKIPWNQVISFLLVKKSFSVGRSKTDREVVRQKSTSTDLKRPTPNTSKSSPSETKMRVSRTDEEFSAVHSVKITEFYCHSLLKNYTGNWFNKKYCTYVHSSAFFVFSHVRTVQIVSYTHTHDEN